MFQTIMSFPFATISRDELLPSLLAEVDKRIEKAQQRANPIFLHMLGIPGSGKTSFVEALVLHLNKRPPVVVGFDRLMAAIPEYMKATDREEAFARFELPARAAGYFLLRELLAKKTDILLDHGGSFPEHIDMLKYARQEQGYRVIIVRVIANKSTVKHRIQIRQEQEGRHTPLNYVDEREKIISELLKAYEGVANHYFEILNETEFEPSSALFGSESSQIATCWGQ